jgi:hypothetical protein
MVMGLVAYHRQYRLYSYVQEVVVVCTRQYSRRLKRRTGPRDADGEVVVMVRRLKPGTSQNPPVVKRAVQDFLMPG